MRCQYESSFPEGELEFNKYKRPPANLRVFRISDSALLHTMCLCDYRATIGPKNIKANVVLNT